MSPVEQQSPEAVQTIENETAPAQAGPCFLDQFCFMIGAPIAKLFHMQHDEDDKWDMARTIMRHEFPESEDFTEEVPQQAVSDHAETAYSEEGMTDLIEAFEASEIGDEDTHRKTG